MADMRKSPAAVVRPGFDLATLLRELPGMIERAKSKRSGVYLTPSEADSLLDEIARLNVAARKSQEGGAGQ